MEPTEDLSRLRLVHGVDQQAGVLAWLPDCDPLRFVLVTSRRTKRWVLPKGGVDEGMTASAAAAQEALEEAGVMGRISETPFGMYRQPKIRPPLIWTVEVTVYSLEITEVLDVWIEADQRERRFVTLEEARDLVTDPDILGTAERFVMSREGGASQ